MSIAALEYRRAGRASGPSAGSLRELTVSTDVVGEDPLGGCLRNASALDLVSLYLPGCEHLSLLSMPFTISDTLSLWEATEKKYRGVRSTLASTLVTELYLPEKSGRLMPEPLLRPEVLQIVELATRGTWKAEFASVAMQAAQDAIRFLIACPVEWGSPRISAAEDGEFALEWLEDGKEAVVSFDGDGAFGYAMLVGERFRPGNQDGRLDAGFEVPDDLREYMAAG